VLTNEGSEDLNDGTVIDGTIAHNSLKRIDAADTNVDLLAAELFDRCAEPFRQLPFSVSALSGTVSLAEALIACQLTAG
jgi:hypothetical protein